MMVESDLRVRSFDGSLTRFYLDALLGLFAVRTHGAERAVRSEHSGMLMDWMRAAYDRLRVSVIVDAFEAIVGFALAVWLTFDYLHRTPEPAAVLLLLYWGLNVPQLGQEIASGARQYPAIRNLMLRLLEPLGALEEKDEPGSMENLDETTGTFRYSQVSAGVSLAFRGVAVRASGRTILEPFDLTIPSGQHVGIVGPSGAGKSSFVGLLLGWHRPAEGMIYVDNGALRGERLLRLRTETAWVDPAVQLWNRSMLSNLEYGSTGESRVGKVLEEADLIGLLERLPDGLQTDLGEGGALVSGGEGQRVRLGRAMMRPESRLVILDEPFRGLDRERRSALLKRARELWKEATVLCVTHDVGETQDFDRVLVIEDGRICEDGPPAKLLAKEAGRYRALLDAEEEVRRKLWMGSEWRRLTVRSGRVVEAAVGPPRVGRRRRVERLPAQSGSRSRSCVAVRMAAFARSRGARVARARERERAARRGPSIATSPRRRSTAKGCRAGSIRPPHTLGLEADALHVNYGHVGELGCEPRARRCSTSTTRASRASLRCSGGRSADTYGSSGSTIRRLRVPREAVEADAPPQGSMR